MGLPILLVEDEPRLRGVIAELLRQDGHDVVEADGVDRAVELFRHRPFPLVLAELFYAGGSGDPGEAARPAGGMELLEALRRQDPDVLVVLMTCHASVETATEALRSGAYDYLVKPFEDLELISAVVQRAAERVRLIQDKRGLTERLRRYAGKLEALNQKLRSMTTRDGQTGLHNRRHFLDSLGLELARAARHGRPFSVLLLDIDHFRQYNDTHGHLAGDQVLVDLARLLLEDRRASTLVARWGGDEFAMLVPEAGRDGALRLAEVVRDRVDSQRYRGAESQPCGRITLSLGVATFPCDGDEVATLVEAAEGALAAAKRGGRNAVVCRERVSLESGSSVS